MKLILGSKSPGRKKILAKMGYNFTVIDPNIEEKTIRHKDPKKLVIAIARAKAQAILPKIHEAALLLTADQVVRCNNQILEKPRDQNEARNFLHMYLKYPAETITAIVITNTATKKQIYGVDIAKIWLSTIPNNVIEKLVQKKYVINCAGGFSLDDSLFKKYVIKIAGTEESITGLPVELTKQLITKTICPGGTAG